MFLLAFFFGFSCTFQRKALSLHCKNKTIKPYGITDKPLNMTKTIKIEDPKMINLNELLANPYSELKLEFQFGNKSAIVNYNGRTDLFGAQMFENYKRKSYKIYSSDDSVIIALRKFFK